MNGLENQSISKYTAQARSFRMPIQVNEALIKQVIANKIIDFHPTGHQSTRLLFFCRSWFVRLVGRGSTGSPSYMSVILQHRGNFTHPLKDRGTWQNKD
jgi:hypothetical protein